MKATTEDLTTRKNSNREDRDPYSYIGVHNNFL